MSGGCFPGALWSLNEVHVEYSLPGGGVWTMLRGFRAVILKEWSQQAASASPGNFREMQIIGPHPRPAASETVEAEPYGWFWSTLRFENHCCRGHCHLHGGGSCCGGGWAMTELSEHLWRANGEGLGFPCNCPGQAACPSPIQPSQNEAFLDVLIMGHPPACPY